MTERRGLEGDIRESSRVTGLLPLAIPGDCLPSGAFAASSVASAVPVSEIASGRESRRKSSESMYPC